MTADRDANGFISSPIYCDHANENPSRCICQADCYCKANTCKNPDRWADHAPLGSTRPPARSHRAHYDAPGVPSVPPGVQCPTCARPVADHGMSELATCLLAVRTQAPRVAARPPRAPAAPPPAKSTALLYQEARVAQLAADLRAYEEKGEAFAAQLKDEQTRFQEMCDHVWGVTSKSIPEYDTTGRMTGGIYMDTCNTCGKIVQNERKRS